MVTVFGIGLRQTLPAFATDSGVPDIVKGAPSGATYQFMGDEHGRITFAYPDDRPGRRVLDTSLRSDGQSLRLLSLRAGRSVRRSVADCAWPLVAIASAVPVSRGRRPRAYSFGCRL